MIGKRIWTDDETLAFVGFMEELVLEGMRVKAGQFKPGSFGKLAGKMLEKFPGCDITAKHCKNKHKRLKEKYQSAADMLAWNGFGWDDEKKSVKVDNQQVLQIYLKQHPHRFYTPGKPFPLFHRLEVIFGKNKATGNFALPGNDAKEQQLAEDDEQQIGSNDVDMSDPAPANIESPIQASALMASSCEKNQVRSVASAKTGEDVEILNRLADSLAYAIDQQGKHVRILARALTGVVDDLNFGQKLKDLGVSDDDVMAVALKFSNNPQLEKVMQFSIEKYFVYTKKSATISH